MGTPKLNEKTKSNWNIKRRVLYVIIILSSFSVVYNASLLYGQQLQETQNLIIGLLPWHKSEKASAGWKTYTNSEYGFEFKYPSKLILSEKNGIVTLVHTIPYRNYGDCDMVGDDTIFENLVDIKISLEISSKKITPSYVDGPAKFGALNGQYAYQGAEGCGIIEYYFPAGSGTLLVKQDAVQALSGISSLWNKEEILKVPGVITPAESKTIFGQILSSFKFTSPSTSVDTSTWKTCVNLTNKYEFRYPTDWKVWKYSPGEAVSSACPEGNMFSPTLPYGHNQLVVTVFEGTSLNDYINKLDQRAFSEINIDGVRAILIVNSANSKIVVFYNASSEFHLEFLDVNDSIMNSILSYFKFTK